MKNRQTKREFLKYKIRKFSINYSKTIAKKRKKQIINLELKLKNLENNLNSEEKRKLYNHCKNDLETIYDFIAACIKIRSRCEWYDKGRSIQGSF